MNYRNKKEQKLEEMFMKETRVFLKKIGMPEGDAYNLPTSEKRFSDGCLLYTSDAADE